jgi:DNA primase
LLRQSLQDKSKAQPSKTPRQGSGLQQTAGAQRDRELLQFAICYPEYLSKLQELGLEGCLQTQRAQDFWQKLVQYGHHRVYAYLDQAEGNFFARCLSPQDKGAAPQPEVWQDIRELLLRSKRRQRQQRLQQDLRAAQEAGDTSRLSELLNEYSNLLREEG